jgi:hypothetical protein
MSDLHQIQTAKSIRWLPEATANSDLAAVALFCALGLLITLYVVIRHPEFGAIIAQFSRLIASIN